MELPKHPTHVGCGVAQRSESGRVQAAVLEPCRALLSADLTGGAGDVQVLPIAIVGYSGMRVRFSLMAGQC